jgi:hypothetical protein
MDNNLTLLHIETPKTMFNYSYGRYYSKGVLVLSSILTIAGFFTISAGLHISLPFLFPGVLMATVGIISFFPIELLQINNITKEYRVAFKLGSYIKGDWKKLGNIQYVSIIDTNKYISLSGDYKGEAIKECRLRLFKKAGYTYDIDNYKSKESAMFIGSIIAKGLNLRLLDATQRPPVFLNL